MTICPQCGARLPDDATCETYFHELLAREFANTAGAGAVHHLTVLCYMLQHNRYSAAACAWAHTQLGHSLRGALTGAALRRGIGQTPDQQQRAYSVRGTHITAPPDAWTQHIGAVAAHPAAEHVARVTAWAWSVLATLDHQASHKEPAHAPD